VAVREPYTRGCENEHMPQRPRVFLDTSVVKHSIRKKTVLRPNPPKQVRFGNTTYEAVVHSVVTYDPTEKVGEPLRTEIDRLSDIAAFAKAGEIELLWQVESHVEFLGTYSIPGGGQSELLEAGVTMVEGPIPYGRVLSPTKPGETWSNLQSDFLKSLHNAGFETFRRRAERFRADKFTNGSSSTLFTSGVLRRRKQRTSSRLI
jgi:hypothetical protein